MLPCRVSLHDAPFEVVFNAGSTGAGGRLGGWLQLPAN